MRSLLAAGVLGVLSLACIGLTPAPSHAQMRWYRQPGFAGYGSSYTSFYYANNYPPYTYGPSISYGPGYPVYSSNFNAAVQYTPALGYYGYWQAPGYPAYYGGYTTYTYPTYHNYYGYWPY